MIYQFIIVNQALIREQINGSIMVLCGYLTAMIFIFMCNSWINAFKKHMTMNAWTHMPGVPMACALLWVFGAEAHRAGMIWHIYRFAPAHISLGSFSQADFISTFGYLISGCILIGALLRCTFLFAPPTMRQFVSWASAITAVGFLMISYLTH